MQIERVTVDDLEAIATLHAHFWGEVSDVESMRRALERLERDANHILLAARVDGVCVGTATGVICHGLYGGFDSYLVVEDVVVDPNHRRRGLGRALLGELERTAREHSCTQMVLLTETCREDAMALYESVGFEGHLRGFKKKL